MTLIPSAYDFQIALQVDKDTPATNPTHWLRCLAGSNIMADPEVVTVHDGEGTRMADGISFVAGAPVAGTLEAVVQEGMLPLLLIGTMGTMMRSGIADPYSHAATVNQTGGLPYLTVFKHVSGKYERFPGCGINTLRLQTSTDGENQILRATIGLVGIDLPVSYTAEPAVPATAEDADVIFMWDQAAGNWSIDSTPIAGISQWILDINNNTEVVPGELKTGYMLWPKRCEVTCSSKLVIEDWERYNSFMYGSASPSNATPMDLSTIPSGDFSTKLIRVAAAPGPERSFAVSIPDLRYAVGEKPSVVPDPEGKPIYQTVAGYAVGSDPKITCTVVNGTGSYLEEGS